MTGSLKPTLPRAVWTEAHLAELETVFPERTDAAQADDLHRRVGQRSVVQWVRTRMAQREQR